MKNMFSKGAHPSEFGHRQTTMLMLGLFLLVSQCLFAQSRIIKGTVYDEHCCKGYDDRYCYRYRW